MRIAEVGITDRHTWLGHLLCVLPFPRVVFVIEIEFPNVLVIILEKDGTELIYQTPIKPEFASDECFASSAN